MDKLFVKKKLVFAPGYAVGKRKSHIFLQYSSPSGRIFKLKVYIEDNNPSKK